MRLRLISINLVLYTAGGLKDWQAAVTNGPIVRIRPGYEGDAGLLKHELVHAAQWWVGMLLGALVALLLCVVGRPEWPWALCTGASAHPLLYLMVPRYRLMAEVMAYRVQGRCYKDDRRALFARFIAERYSLKVTEAQALALLQS